MNVTKVFFHQQNLFTMKNVLMIILAISLSISITAQDDSMAGTYMATVATDDGEITMTMEIMDNGNYSLDNDGDGIMDVFAKYEVHDDETVTIWHVSGDDCHDKGKYQIATTDSTISIEVIDDPCDGRIPPDGKLTWTKK